MKNARKVLKTMRAIPVGVFDSKDYVADFFSGNIISGFNLQLYFSRVGLLLIVGSTSVSTYCCTDDGCQGGKQPQAIENSMCHGNTSHVTGTISKAQITPRI